MRRRSKLRILVDILRVVEGEGAAKVTHILYGANLSYDRLVKYLAELEGKGLIARREREGSAVYVLTEKGRKFLREFRKVEKFAEAFGIEI